VLATPNQFTEVEVAIYELLMQSYTDNFGDMVSQPQIVTSCTVIGQELAGRRRRSLFESLFGRLLQPAPDVLLVMTFTIQYESRYGYDVDDYPQRFQAYINNNLEQITEDMAARFLPVIEAREVIVFNSNEPTEAPTEVVTTTWPFAGSIPAPSLTPPLPSPSALTPIGEPPAAPTVFIEIGPTQALPPSTDNTCNISHNITCDSVAFTATTRVFFIPPFAANQDTTFSATVIFHFDVENVTIPSQPYTPGTEFDILSNQFRVNPVSLEYTHTFVEDGQYNVGYSIIFDDDDVTGACAGKTFTSMSLLRMDQAPNRCIVLSPPVPSPTAPTANFIPTGPVAPTMSPAPSTNRNYCGTSQKDAQKRCAMAIPCPDGIDIVCLKDQECYQISGPCNAASQGNFNSETIASPISPAPIQTTPSPSISPTDNPTDWRTFDRNTTHFCGIDYEDVVKNCYKNRPCPTETDGECPGNQTCFLDIAFANENCNTPQPTTSLTPSYYVVTDGPTPSPTTAPPTMEPTFTPTEGYIGDDFNGGDNCMCIPSFLLQSLFVNFIVWGVLL